MPQHRSKAVRTPQANRPKVKKSKDRSQGQKASEDTNNAMSNAASVLHLDSFRGSDAEAETEVESPAPVSKSKSKATVIRPPREKKVAWVATAQNPHICCICGIPYSRRETLRAQHFAACVRSNGNPKGLAWDSDPTCWRQGSDGPSGRRSDGPWGINDLKGRHNDDGEGNDIDQENLQPGTDGVCCARELLASTAKIQ